MNCEKAERSFWTLKATTCGLFGTAIPTKVIVKSDQVLDATVGGQVKVMVV
jgi:hypothetical protein